MGEDRSGGEYRSCGTEIHEMGVDSCTLYKHVRMYQNGGEGQCGDQVGAPGAREKDTERGTAARRSLSSGHDLLFN